jgi:hypothetical protein
MKLPNILTVIFSGICIPSPELQVVGKSNCTSRKFLGRTRVQFEFGLETEESIGFSDLRFTRLPSTRIPLAVWTVGELVG